jgi:hypothetical protein
MLILQFGFREMHTVASDYLTCSNNRAYSLLASSSYEPRLK